MSEEEKLDAIRREVWWLSTFLVKIPLIISAFAAVVWIAQANKTEILAGFESGKLIKVALAIIAIAVGVGLLSYFLWIKRFPFSRGSGAPNSKASEDEAKPDSNAGEE